MDPDNLNNHRDANNTVGLEMAIDNSNFNGVFGGTGATTGDPENVVTGVEFSIPLSSIGNPSGDIRVTTFINGDGHHFASNQFGGEGILSGNLGGDGTGGFTGDLQGVNLANISGDQFVTISNSATLDGDFNVDGIYNCSDVDAIVIAIAGMTADVSFDLTGYGVLDTADLHAWLAQGAAAYGVPSPYGDGD